MDELLIESADGVAAGAIEARRAAVQERGRSQ